MDVNSREVWTAMLVWVRVPPVVLGFGGRYVVHELLALPLGIRSRVRVSGYGYSYCLQYSTVYSLFDLITSRYQAIDYDFELDTCVGCACVARTDTRDLGLRVHAFSWVCVSRDSTSPV